MKKKLKDKEWIMKYGMVLSFCCLSLLCIASERERNGKVNINRVESFELAQQGKKTESQQSLKGLLSAQIIARELPRIRKEVQELFAL
jgi:hypothetical protein